MAVSSLPGIGFTLTLPDATTLVPVDGVAFGASAIPVPDNCRTIIVYNMDAANRIFAKFERTALIALPLMVVASCTVIPALSSMSYDVGYIGDRPILSSVSSTNLYFVAEAGVNVQVNVTYLMGRGSQLP